MPKNPGEDMVQETEEQHDSRGRQAQQPSDLPKTGWRDILLRVKEQQKKDHLYVIAAGVAFFAMLAIFPALAAGVSIYGLIADPVQMQQQLSHLSGLLPQEAHQVIAEQLSRIVESSTEALSIGVIGGLFISLWSSTKGMKAMIIALNVAYDEEDNRGFFKLNGLAILLTVGGIAFILIVLGLILALPSLLGNFGLPVFMQTMLKIGRWFLLALMIITALGILYRFGPNRANPRWQWASTGSIVATFLWIVASFLFSYYASNFGNYNETYGSMGAIIILLMWFFLTAYAVLLGAELNAEMEHQTRCDTTCGEPKPMGQRGAYVADTLGESHPKKK